MQIDLQKIEGTKIEVSIIMDSGEVAQTREKVFNRLNKEVKIAGFRPGKVPRTILERYIDEDTLRREIIQVLLEEGIRYAVKEKNLRIITYPQIKEIGELKKDSDFKFKVEMELFPEIKLPEYKGIILEKEKLEITQEKVEEALKILQEKYAYLEEVKDRPAQKGDFVFIEYEGKVGEKAISEKKVAGIELGKGEFLLQLEEKIEGMRAGEEKEISLALPEDYQQKEFAGKMANFKILVKEIKIKKVPELSEEFAKSLNFENLEKLREAVKKDLENRLKIIERNILENKLQDKLLKESELDIPPSLLEEEKNIIWKSLEENLKKQNKTLEDYLKERNITKEDLEKEVAESAENSVKTTLIIEEIASRENIKVTQADRDKILNNWAESMGEDPVKFKENLAKDKKRLIYMDNNILRRKVLDFLLNSAQIKEKD